MHEKQPLATFPDLKTASGPVSERLQMAISNGIDSSTLKNRKNWIT